MLENGFYDLTWGRPDDSAEVYGLKLDVDSRRRYNTLLDSLTGNGLYGYGPRAFNVGQVEEGHITHVHLRGRCACERACEMFDDTLLARCEECNPRQYPLYTLAGLEVLYGARFHILDKEVLDPIEERVEEEIRERNQMEIAGHLEILADPNLQDLWIEENGSNVRLVMSFLMSAVQSGSALDVHQDAARKLARLHKDALENLSKALSLSDHPNLGPIGTLIDLANS